MQIILLILLSMLGAGVCVWLNSFWLAEAQSNRRHLILFLGLTLLNAFGTVVFEGIKKAGRPTFYYHTHAPGPVTLKMFLAGVLLTSMTACLLLWLYNTKLKHRITRTGVLPYLTRAFVFSLLLAIVAELFIFNYRHYELIGYDKPTLRFERGDYGNSMVFFNRASQTFTPFVPSQTGEYEIGIFPNYQKIRNVTLSFDNGDEFVPISINYDDRAFSIYNDEVEHMLVKRIPRSYNIPLHTIGNTHHIGFRFLNDSQTIIKEFVFPSIIINQLVPLEISPVRLLLVFSLIFVLYCLAPGSALYAIKLDLHSKSQTALCVLMLAVCFAFFIWTSFSSYSGSSQSFSEQKAQLSQSHLQYNRLVDALMVPRYALIEAPDHNVVNWELPYDMSYRSRYPTYYYWDTVYYQGQYYVYFGIVPAASVLLPYKLLTGNHLELDYAILLFCILGILGLYGLYSRIIQQCFPDLPFILFLCGFLLIVFTLNLTWCLRRALVYELAITSGFCFAVWSIFLTWRAFEYKKTAYLLLFGAGLSAALAVGCRPPLLLISILIIPLFINAFRRSGKFFSRHNWLSLIVFTIPYIAVGLMLMKYNYERFGDVSEFGIRYQLTAANESITRFRTGISGTLASLFSYYFTMPQLDAAFPFIHLQSIQIPHNGFLLYDDMLGLFAFPLVWLVFALPFCRSTLRQKGLGAYCAVSLLVGVLLTIVCSMFSVTFRYLVDFAWLFTLPAVIVLFCFWEYAREKSVIWMPQLLSVGSFLCGLLIFLSLSVTGEEHWLERINPNLWYQLRYMFEFWL